MDALETRDVNDYSPDDRDRAEWDRAWASMPHRRLLNPPKIGVAGSLGPDCGAVISSTIAEDPPQFTSTIWRSSDDCPVCGASTQGTQRLPATLYPTFASGFSLGVGVWLHRSCFDGCRAADETAPVPW